MSIVESLKWLFDPATRRYEQGEKAAERELPAAVEDGDPPSFAVPDLAPDATRYRCKVCGVIAGDPEFCFDCLAATMVSVAPDTPRSALPSSRRRRSRR